MGGEVVGTGGAGCSGFSQYSISILGSSVSVDDGVGRRDLRSLVAKS